MEHDGTAYEITVPTLEVLDCQACQNRKLPDESFEKVLQALYEKAGLLTPSEIRNKRESLGLTQKQLATFMTVPDSTVSRWETGGQIQQRAMDKLLRVFFDLPEVRAYLGATVMPQMELVSHN
jgi:putative zinc finger/helix-turn-helix YgiT family protein